MTIDDLSPLDKNGYSKSLLNDNSRDYRSCYVCGRTDGKIDRHEIFFGSNRRNSKMYGMWCDLCRSCHSEVHRGNGELDTFLKIRAQTAFEKTKTRFQFMQIFGKNYLG